MSAILAVVLLLGAEETGLRAMQLLGKANWQDLDYAGNTKAKNGSTLIKLVVAPDGKPNRCDILLGTGNKALEESVCDHAMARLRYKPARSADGEATFGVAEFMVDMFAERGGATHYVRDPDYMITLARMPEGMVSGSYMNRGVQVDQRGMIQACGSAWNEPVKRKFREAVQQLEPLACDQLFKLWDPLREVDRDGKPISYVRVISVGFEQAGAAKEVPK